jgi:uncharacterized protein YodC (DUF2158 family)
MEQKPELRLGEGDVVTTCKISGPKMVVSKLVREKEVGPERRESFKGVECYWFDSSQNYCKAIFHTKDLELLVSHTNISKAKPAEAI